MCIRDSLFSEAGDDLRLDVHLGRGLESESFKHATTTALLYERALRGRRPGQPESTLMVAPWLVEGLREASPFKLFIGTTQVNTGKLRVFRETEVSIEVLLASACLPKIHRSVEIDGEPYWDGGYCANPAVYPLFYDCDSRDVLLVLLSPLKREGTPRSVEEIELRIVELAFSANFMREMRMFAQAAEFSGPAFMTWGRLERRLQKMRFHMVDASQLISLQRTETQLISHGPFLELLRDQGRERANRWLLAHGADVGKRASIDLKQCFA